MPNRQRTTLVRWPVLVALAAPIQPSAAQDQSAEAAVTIDIDVVAKKLDEARQQIQPSLGASAYNFSPESLDTIPQAGAAPLNQVLLQAPGVAQDSFGQIHLRGEHANVQYRLNGVELPEGLSVFGQAIESRFANSMTLITGALPAQYGFQTAGVVDIQTKTGTTNPGGDVSLYGGHGTGCSPASLTAGPPVPGTISSPPTSTTTTAASRTRQPLSTPSTTPPTSSTAWPTSPTSSILTPASA